MSVKKSIIVVRKSVVILSMIINVFLWATLKSTYADTNTISYQQWKKCFGQLIRIWSGAISYSLEHGLAAGQKIYLTNLYWYAVPGTNMYKCPSGQSYKPVLDCEFGPVCFIHPIDGAEIIAPYVKADIGMTFDKKVSFMDRKYPSGVRRFALYDMWEEEAKQHPDDLKKVLIESLKDDDEMLRYLAQDKINDFAKSGFNWAIELKNNVGQKRPTQVERGHP